MIHTPSDSGSVASGSTAGDGHSPGLLSLVVGSPDRPSCTVYPPDVAAPYRSTRWMTARGTAFVEVEQWR